MISSYPRLSQILAYAALPVVWGVVRGAPPLEEGAEPPLRRLIELNAEALFGGKIGLEEKGERFTLEFGDGRFERAFECRSRGKGFVSQKDRVPEAAKPLLHEAQGQFSFVGYDSGTALSKFELADDFRITFKLRIVKDFFRSSLLIWQLNHQGGRSFILLDFFRRAEAWHNGARKQVQLARDPRFLDLPYKWFDRKSKGVPVEIIYKDAKLTVRMQALGGGDDEKKEMTDLIVLDGVTEPASGRIALRFDNIQFLVSDLKIQGKLPRPWIEKELERLRRSGELKTEEERRPSGEEGEEVATKKKKQETGPDLDKPDPEADEEL